MPSGRVHSLALEAATHGGQEAEHTMTTPAPEEVATLHRKWSALDIAQRKDILRGLPSAVVVNYGEAIEELVVEKLKGRQSLRVAERMRPFVEFVDMLGSVAAALDSTIVPGASVIFQVVKSIFLASKALVDLQAYLVELIVDKVSSSLRLITRYRDVFHASPELLLAAIDIYEVVVEVGNRAMSFFYDSKGNTRSGLRLLASTSWSSCKGDLELLSRKFDARLKTFDRAALLALSQTTKSSLQSLNSHHSQQQSHLRRLEAGISRQTGLLLDEQTQRNGEVTATLAKNRRELLAWIGDSTSRLNSATIHDKLQRAAVKGTADWLSAHGAFRSWLNPRGPKGLWIWGGWGTGKSVLASAVIQLLLGRTVTEEGAACAYIYCSSEYPFLASGTRSDVDPGHAISYKTILGSILFQLYGALPLGRDVDSVVQLWTQDSSLLETQLEQATRDVINLLGRPFIVIDGLDELQRTDDADFVALCKFIGSFNMTTADTGLRTLIFSRPEYQDISSAMFGSAWIRLDGKANQGNIAAFVNEEVTRLGRLGRYEQQIKEHLLKHADGVFRWVSAVVSYIRPLKSPRLRAEAVENMPPDLKDVYVKILESILQQGDISRNYALMALLWVTHAFRPLSVREMADALSVEPGMETIDDDDRIDPHHIGKLCENCCGLLELSGGVYRLPHDSVRDFLLGAADQNHRGIAEFWVLRAHAHERLAEACLAYLHFNHFDVDSSSFRQEMVKLRQHYPLLEYASDHWGGHVREVGSDLPVSLDQSIHHFLESHNRRRNALQVVQEHERNPWVIERRQSTWDKRPYVPDGVRSTLPLHHVALFGLEHLFPSFQPTSIQQLDEFGFMPIDYAILRRRKSTFHWLLSRSAHAPGVKAMAPQPFYALTQTVAAIGWSDSVQRLLDLGCDKNERDFFQWTPLHAAASGGSLDTLRVLLKAGADLNPRDKRGGTPLLITAHNRHTALCEVLINSGADINAALHCGQTPLHHLAKFDPHMVEMLLEKQAVFGPSDDGWTPLHHAAASGRAEIVRALCSHLHGDGRGRARLLHEIHRRAKAGPVEVDVLTLSLDNKHLEVAKVLIEEFGADPSSLSLSGSKATILHIAANNGQDAWIPYIAGSCNVNPNAQAAEGLTALHCAVQGGHIKFSTILLGTYDNLDCLLPDDSGRLPLHSAAANGNAELVALLSQYGQDVPDEDGCLPFHCAVYNGHLACVRLLYRDEIMATTNNKGSTAVRIAVVEGWVSVASYLLEMWNGRHKQSDATVPPPQPVPGFQNRDIKPSLLSIESYNVLRPATFLDSLGRSLLFPAVDYSYAEMVRLLVQSGIALDDPDDTGWTPLMVAASYGNVGMVQLLIQLGSDVRRTDWLGRTALHWAVIRGFPRTARALLAADSDAAPSAEDALGMTAVEYGESWPLLSKVFAKGYEDDRRTRGKRRRLRQFIERASQALSFSNHVELDSEGAKQRRSLLLEALNFAQRHVCEYEDARLAFAEVAYLDAVYGCDLCHSDLCDAIDSLHYLCAECPNTLLCGPCHDMYVRSSCRKPDDVGRLERLGARTRLVAQSLSPLTRFNARTIVEVLRADSRFADWVERSKQQYDRVADARPELKVRDGNTYVGWDVLTLLSDSLMASSQNGQRDDDIWDEINIILAFPDPRWLDELWEFPCRGHHYLEVAHLQRLSDDDRKYFRSDDRLDSSYFAMLAEKYSTSGEATGGPVVEPMEGHMTAGSGKLATGISTACSDSRGEEDCGCDESAGHPEASEIWSEESEDSVTDLDDVILRADELLEDLSNEPNPYPDGWRWQKSVCKDPAVTLRDVAWELAKAIMAGDGNTEMLQELRENRPSPNQYPVHRN